MDIVVIGLLSLIVLGVISCIIGYMSDKRKGLYDDEEDKPLPDGECCGQHAVCERDSLLAGVKPVIEYYDDRELDVFAGIRSDSYTTEQVEQFMDVLYTMRTEDVPGWIRSLQMRGIELPDQLKDAVIFLVSELRSRRGNKKYERDNPDEWND